MFFDRNSFQTNPIGRQEPFSERFRRFIRTQPVLAVLIAQTIATYLFLQVTFWYGLFFVLLLYFGGVFLRQYYNDITLLTVYLASAIAGFFTFRLMFPAHAALFNPLLLASIQGSAVAGILTFTAVARPDLKLRIFILMAIQYRLIAVLLLIMMILRSDLAGGGTHLAYLSGAAVAALLALTTGQHLFDKPVQWIKTRRQIRRRKNLRKYETVNIEGDRPLRDEHYNDIRAERQSRIDAILDKISRSGYDSLSSEEKELLFKQSN